MAGFDDLARKAKDLLDSESTKKALGSEQAEGISDSVLGAVAGFADTVTGGKFTDKIEDARDSADKRIGTDTATDTPASTPEQ